MRSCTLLQLVNARMRASIIGGHHHQYVRFRGDIAERELNKAGLPYEVWTPELMREINKNGLRVVKNE